MSGYLFMNSKRELKIRCRNHKVVNIRFMKKTELRVRFGNQESKRQQIHISKKKTGVNTLASDRMSKVAFNPLEFNGHK